MPGKTSRHNIQRIRRNVSYTVEEVTACLGVHENTVRAWLRSGLTALDDKRPLLIHGAVLAAFLKEKRDARRCPLQPHEFFCMKCRAPRPAQAGKVTATARNQKTFYLAASCTICGTSMRKAASHKNYDAEHQATTVQAHLSDTSAPSVDCDLKGEPQI